MVHNGNTFQNHVVSGQVRRVNRVGQIYFFTENSKKTKMLSALITSSSTSTHDSGFEELSIGASK